MLKNEDAFSLSELTISTTELSEDHRGLERGMMSYPFSYPETNVSQETRPTDHTYLEEMQQLLEQEFYLLLFQEFTATPTLGLSQQVEYLRGVCCCCCCYCCRLGGL